MKPLGVTVPIRFPPGITSFLGQVTCYLLIRKLINTIPAIIAGKKTNSVTGAAHRGEVQGFLITQLQKTPPTIKNPIAAIKRCKIICVNISSHLFNN